MENLAIDSLAPDDTSEELSEEELVGAASEALGGPSEDTYEDTSAAPTRPGAGSHGADASPSSGRGGAGGPEERARTHDASPVRGGGADLLGVAAAYWARVDLDRLRPRLDASAAEVAGEQETAAAHRKALADATKEFRRAVDRSDPTAKAVGGLLRQYQVSGRRHAGRRSSMRSCA
eukprot:306665-Chlamydomonas_euryale.AAC.3